ncbi:hypothetical protein Lal_00049413, partial [Lupinus albus]
EKEPEQSADRYLTSFDGNSFLFINKGISHLKLIIQCTNFFLELHLLPRHKNIREHHHESLLNIGYLRLEVYLDPCNLLPEAMLSVSVDKPEIEELSALNSSTSMRSTSTIGPCKQKKDPRHQFGKLQTAFLYLQKRLLQHSPSPSITSLLTLTEYWQPHPANEELFWLSPSQPLDRPFQSAVFQITVMPISLDIDSITLLLLSSLSLGSNIEEPKAFPSIIFAKASPASHDTHMKSSEPARMESD